ncbi:GDSL-type esterase/lipase family protein [Paenibacillus sp. FJAT-27812]|uniref:GDSL-type esterase/lipase family protein n=1 Tax=Paenibacillus sp. FJAT-27812 TaxID=1684143 RepID=UPI0007C7A489|nr:GDSL-type esterase/lipase family protein [Paenibacillus sp. FJAT-27812]
MKATWLWRFLAVSSICATTLLCIGFGWAVKDTLYPTLESGEAAIEIKQDAMTPEAGSLKEAKEIRIVALGDSLTKGTGDHTGEGYVKQAAEGLRDQWKKPVKIVNNLAINGLRADQLADRLEHDQGFAYALKSANLIFLSIGGNDLFQNTRAKNTGRKLSAYSMWGLATEIPAALNQLARVVTSLNKINSSAKKVYIGLYNPFYDIKELRGGSLGVQQWNEEAYTLLHSYPNMMMIPTFDLFEGKIAEHVSNDHFHPNHEGYGKIAARILDSLD